MDYFSRMPSLSRHRLLVWDQGCPFQKFCPSRTFLSLKSLQIIIVTAIAIVVYSIQVYGFLSTIEFRQLVSLPIDSSLLASFGLGQGAYLAKKLVGNLGES